MRIVVEGPDNAGKSTLCEAIASMTGRPVVFSGGREQYPYEIVERSLRLLSEPNNVIHDRHPIISQPIYGEVAGSYTPIPAELTDRLYFEQQPLFIYCRPPDDRGMVGHTMGPSDTPEYVASLERNYGRLLELYDDWAVHRAHLIYRIGQPYRPIFTYIRDYQI